MAEVKKAGRPPVKKTQDVTSTTQKAIVNDESETVVEDKQVGTKSNTVNKIPKAIKIPLDYIIPVKSGVQGGLTYVSRKSGYEVVWDSFGMIEYLPYEELVAMRNSNKRFYVDNWIYFEDTDDYTADDIYKSLLVDKYYKNILDLENIDDLLSLECEKLKLKLENASNGLKDTVVTRAKQLMMENDPIMDSISKRETIEKMFGVELIPKDI